MIKITETIDMTGHTTSIGIVTVETQVVSVKTVDYRDLWNELHTQVSTSEQFVQWTKKVPKFGCSCAEWLKSYLIDHPCPNARYEVIRAYGWTLHNAVNEKLRNEGRFDKPFFQWSEFEEKYPLAPSS